MKKIKVTQEDIKNDVITKAVNVIPITEEFIKKQIDIKRKEAIEEIENMLKNFSEQFPDVMSKKEWIELENLSFFTIQFVNY